MILTTWPSTQLLDTEGGEGIYHIFSSQPRPRLKEESCISRLQMEGFKELSPEEDNFLTAVPTNLQPESWSLTWETCY